MVIRDLIGDNPRVYEDTFTAHNQNVIQFAHYPVISAIVKLNGVDVSGTLNSKNGTFTPDIILDGTVYVRYEAVWFPDEVINSVSVYKNLTLSLLSIGDNKWVMPLPYYPIHFEETNGNVITYDETTNTFYCEATNVQISGTFLDIYATAGTLLLMKASMPEQIKREFSSFSDWANYPEVAKGLQDQAFAWFKMSGNTI